MWSDNHTCVWAISKLLGSPANFRQISPHCANIAGVFQMSTSRLPSGACSPAAVFERSWSSRWPIKIELREGFKPSTFRQTKIESSWWNTQTYPIRKSSGSLLKSFFLMVKPQCFTMFDDYIQKLSQCFMVKSPQTTIFLLENLPTDPGCPRPFQGIISRRSVRVAPRPVHRSGRTGRSGGRASAWRWSRRLSENGGPLNPLVTLRRSSESHNHHAYHAIPRP